MIENDNAKIMFEYICCDGKLPARMRAVYIRDLSFNDAIDYMWTRVSDEYIVQLQCRNNMIANKCLRIQADIDRLKKKEQRIDASITRLTDWVMLEATV